MSAELMTSSELPRGVRIQAKQQSLWLAARACCARRFQCRSRWTSATASASAGRPAAPRPSAPRPRSARTRTSARRRPRSWAVPQPTYPRSVASSHFASAMVRLSMMAFSVAIAKAKYYKKQCFEVLPECTFGWWLSCRGLVDWDCKMYNPVTNSFAYQYVWPPFLLRTAHQKGFKLASLPGHCKIKFILYVTPTYALRGFPHFLHSEGAPTPPPTSPTTRLTSPTTRPTSPTTRPTSPTTSPTTRPTSPTTRPASSTNSVYLFSHEFKYKASYLSGNGYSKLCCSLGFLRILQRAYVLCGAFADKDCLNNSFRLTERKSFRQFDS